MSDASGTGEGQQRGAREWDAPEPSSADESSAPDVGWDSPNGGWEAPEAPSEQVVPPPAPPSDPNLIAIERAGLDESYVDWLRQVAGQVDPRLDRVNPGWREQPQSAAARACAFGLLMGQLAGLYEHAREQLGRVAETHPSYGSLPAGERLRTLYELSSDPQRATAWIGPLVGTQDPQAIRQLFD